MKNKMKSILQILGILLLIQSTNNLLAQNKGVSFAEHIENLLLSELDDEFKVIAALKVDSKTIGLNRGIQTSTLEDPYLTLYSHVLFTARKPGQSPDWVWGIYHEDENRLLTISEEDFPCFSLDFYSTIDMDLDGNVEISVLCTVGGMLNMWGLLYIYKWDGSDVKLITEMDEYGVSILHSTAPLSFEFVDINGDGIMEIRALMETGDIMSDDYKTETIIWSWNGRLYGKWPDTPEDVAFYPRNLARGSLEVVVSKTEVWYLYEYKVNSEQNSKRPIDEIIIDLNAEDVMGRGPNRWEFAELTAENYVTWSVKHPYVNSKPLIFPGKSEKGFQLESSGPPVPNYFYLKSYNKSHNSEHPDFNLEAWNYYERKNSFRGITLSPGSDLNSIGLEAYTDSLHSWIEVAYENSWITNQGVSQSLKAPLQNTKRQLERGNTRAAANTVQAFLNEVEAVRRNHLTDEGYALLWFNGQYLLERLERESGRER
jgi:hypothetical protein